jgi:hypothetical protein
MGSVSLWENQALPGSGGVLTSDGIDIEGYKFVAITGTYQRGGNGGEVGIFIEFGNDEINLWRQQSAVSDVSVPPGVDTVTQIQKNIYAHKPNSAVVSTFGFSITDGTKINASKMRVNIFERGNQGSPGTASLEVVRRKE